MKAQASLVVTLQLVRDTFRQARASGIGAMMLAVTAVCVVQCLSVTVSGDVSLRDADEPVLFLPRAPRSLAPSLAADPKVRAALTVDPAAAHREGVETLSGRMTLAFGAVSFPVSRERRDAVCFLELVLGGAVAGAFGLVMTLVWTAGFMPGFLERNAASVLLTKLVTRRQLLLGRCLGVLTFVGFHVVLFIGATWLALFDVALFRDAKSA